MHGKRGLFHEGNFIFQGSFRQAFLTRAARWTCSVNGYLYDQEQWLCLVEFGNTRMEDSSDLAANVAWRTLSG